MDKITTLTDDEIKLALRLLNHRDNANSIVASGLVSKLSSLQSSASSEITTTLASKDEGEKATTEVTIEFCGDLIWFKNLTSEQADVDKNQTEEYANGIFGLLECRSGIPALSLGYDCNGNVLHVLSNSDSQLTVMPELNDPSTWKWGEVHFYKPYESANLFGYSFK